MPQERSLPDVLNAIGESFRCGTMPEGEFPMDGLDLEHTVDEFIDAFSSNMAVCTDCLMRWLKDLRRCAMKVIRSLVRYFQSGSEVINHAQELADYLTPAYYAPDYLDIDGMRELMGLLREADNLEQCLDVEEQRRFFHEYNHQLDLAVRRVHDALMGNMPDRAFAMRRKVARLRSDVQEIIRREEKRWTEGLRIDPYATEEELLREAIDCVEGQLSQSLFYCNGADTLMKVVEHILSLTNERIGAQLDHFLYLYAQMQWLTQRLENIETKKRNDMKNQELEEMQKMHCHTYVAAGAINIANIEHVENLYPGSPELMKLKAEAAAPAEGEADALFKYVPDAKQAAHYAQALRNCTSAREVAFVVKGMYNDHIEDDQQIVKKEFIETLLPLLSFEGKSINRIRACINEIVLGK